MSTENEDLAATTKRCPCCGAASCRCHTCNERFACGESLTCPMPHHGTETIPLRCRCGAVMSTGGVITVSGRYVPFTTDTVHARTSLVKRLRTRGRQAAARRREAVAGSREAVAGSREAAAGSREGAASGREAAAGGRAAALFARPLRAPGAWTHAAGNYLHVLERTRAAKRADAPVARTSVSDDAASSETQPTP